MSKDNFHLSSVIAAILMFFFMHPYFTWGVSKYLEIFFSLLLFILFLFNLDLVKERRIILFFAFLIMLLYVPYLQGLNYNGYIMSLAVCTIPFAKRIFAIRTFDSFLSIYVFFITISGLVWVLSLIGAVPSLGILPPWNPLKNYTYIEYPLLVVPNRSGFYRFEGLFDEPGVVGTISVFLLTIKKFDFTDKRLLLVLITGAMSMSFFFYVVILVYYSFFFFVNSKRKIFGLSLILLFLIFYVTTSDNKLMNDVLWSRFEWDSSTGSFVGDNRTNATASKYFDSIVGSREFYTGIGEFDNMEEMVGGSFSIVLAIIQYGIIYVSVYICIFLWYGWKYKTDLMSYLFYVFVFLGSIYQRPNLTDPTFLFCFALMATNYLVSREKSLKSVHKTLSVNSRTSNIIR